MIKIYVQNKPLFLLDELNNEAEAYLNKQGTLFMNELNTSTVAAMLKQLEQPGIATGIILHKDIKELLDAVTASLTLMVAAGGLVYTPDGHLLLIFRRGKWDLPKGKLDEGEDLEECALREIREETGVNNLTMEMPLQVTYHTYYEKDRHILKESHWYLMKAPSKMPLHPQTDEDIERCEWVPVNGVPAYRGNMHASIKDVIDTGLEILKKKTFTPAGPLSPSSS